MLSDGSISGDVRRWLRLEGLAALATAVCVYARTGHSWLLFAVLFLVPDLSFFGYLFGPRIGAAIYNTLHTYTLPAALGCGLWLTDHSIAIPLIWSAHIGFDRVLGYGLKYPTAFRDTHLGQLGQTRKQTDR